MTLKIITKISYFSFKRKIFSRKYSKIIYCLTNSDSYFPIVNKIKDSSFSYLKMYILLKNNNVLKKLKSLTYY